MAWTPYATRQPVWRDIEASRDEDGVAQARVELRPWSTRERLAYNDLAAADGFAKAEDGQRVIRIGRLRLIATSLTVTAAEGFPPVADGTAFDPSNRDHLRELDPDVYAELVALAREVQGLPGWDDPDPEPEQRTEAGDAGDAEEDPTRTPSTPGAASSATSSTPFTPTSTPQS